MSKLKQCREIIGLLPAGGRATRIAPLPCSKELFPIGFHRTTDNSLRPKVVCHYLLEKMRLAGITRAYIVIREGKWDIPAYLGDGKLLDMHLAYLMMRVPYGAPFTLNQAYPFICNATVALGFPDIIFSPDDAFVRLLNHQSSSKAYAVLGIFPADQPQKMDMVDLDKDGRVRFIEIKPVKTHLKYTWVIAVWTPTFTNFMHEYLSKIYDENSRDDADSKMNNKELFVGDVIQAAINNGLLIEGVLFPENHSIDIGTPDNLVKAVKNINID
ncbi:MAG: nucleotidyltransferase [Candidatus Brocadia sapporoensis]|nr:dTDP-glucose pyrophosphorylase [Candidatus Brocadia sp.]GJQ22811.1 MAG: nucleotidyltransferase [Candidatus Brocadia sapporoensis]